MNIVHLFTLCQELYRICMFSNDLVRLQDDLLLLVIIGEIGQGSFSIHWLNHLCLSTLSIFVERLLALGFSVDHYVVGHVSSVVGGPSWKVNVLDGLVQGQELLGHRSSWELGWCSISWVLMIKCHLGEDASLSLSLHQISRTPIINRLSLWPHLNFLLRVRLDQWIVMIDLRHRCILFASLGIPFDNSFIHTSAKNGASFFLGYDFVVMSCVVYYFLWYLKLFSILFTWSWHCSIFCLFHRI